MCTEEVYRIFAEETPVRQHGWESVLREGEESQSERQHLQRPNVLVSMKMDTA